MFLFAVKFNKEKIEEDNLVNLMGAYSYIEREFSLNEVSLYKIKDGIHYYTRNIDKRDFENLFIANLCFRNSSWFCYYVDVWRFLEIDDDTEEVLRDDDMLEEWVKERPELP